VLICPIRKATKPQGSQTWLAGGLRGGQNLSCVANLPRSPSGAYVSVMYDHTTEFQNFLAANSETAESVKQVGIIGDHHALAVEKVVGERLCICHSRKVVFRGLPQRLCNQMVVWTDEYYGLRRFV
jgi:hypothetical protein